MKLRFLPRLLAVLILVLGSLSAFGQGVTTSEISGVVTSGSEPLVGATIKAVHTPSGTIYGTLSNDAGRFTLPGLRVGGPYTITVEYIGFNTFTQNEVFLQLGQAYNLKPNLTEGGVSTEEVVVEGRVDEVLNSSRTGTSTNISSSQLSQLPTINRSFRDFTRLVPQANGLSFGGRSSSFNNITLDGAVFNNSFGLQETIGSQASANPVPLDAVDQIQVNIAPYDVTQGSFTGAGINAITRSGDNEVRASAYGYFRNKNLQGNQVSGRDITVLNTESTVVGFRIGAPIIKNKLFFFVNFENERNSNAASLRVANRPGVTPSPGAGSNTVNVLARDLDILDSVLKAKYNYNVGPYEGYNLQNNSQRLTFRFDYNISEQHHLTLRGNVLNSYGDNPPSLSGSNVTGPLTQVNYLGASYRINNNLDNYVAELKSTFGSSLSNTFQIGYTSMRDRREAIGDGTPFPNVQITNFAQFGLDPFSAGNKLDTDIFQVSDNLTKYLGRHTITVGTYNEFYKFTNGFAPRFYGQFTYGSIAAFYNNIGINPTTYAELPAPLTGGNSPTNYQQQYSAQEGVDFPLAEFDAYQLGFYAQDVFDATDRLKLTFGIRVDIPKINTTLQRNEAVDTLAFQDGRNIDISKYPDAKALFSPRVGINWDIKGDRSLQLRGGSGIFTGRIPYVWVSNQAGNNGLLFGTLVPGQSGTPALNAIEFTGTDIYRYTEPLSGAAANYNLAITDKDFKFPQLWRTDFGLDAKLPFGVIGTIEASYSKDINAIYHRNINLEQDSVFNLTAVGTGTDTREIWIKRTGFVGNDYDPTAIGSTTTVSTFTDNQINGSVSAGDGAILMSNTNEGYSYFISGSLKKDFEIQDNQSLHALLAYTYTDSRTVNDGGSIAASIYRDRPTAGDPNKNQIGNFGGLLRHRFIASSNFRIEYAKNFATTIGFFFEAAPGNRFSHVYGGSITQKGNANNELIYIPRNRGEILLQNINYTVTLPNGGGSVTRTYTGDQQYEDLNAYIESDPSLRDKRGQYATRNAAILPWEYTLDMHIAQDLFLEAGGKRHNLQITLDVFNLLNLINSDWGVRYTNLRGIGSGNAVQLLSARGINAAGQPVYTYNPLVTPFANVNGDIIELQPLRSYSNVNVNSLASRWRMQVGIRYIFNDNR